MKRNNASIKQERLSRPIRIAQQEWAKGVVPLVSIICVTYNHREYIENCLQGFLIQETSFPVEVVVHDDASTDGTQDIVKKYCECYPRLFKSVFQQKNQYSLGKKPSLLALPHASGRYIALCEGDDYWIDKGKLEQQVLALERQPDCNLCFHPALVESLGTDLCSDEEVISNHGAAVKIIDLPSVIEGDGGFCPTASLLIRHRVYERLPDWYEAAPVGDYYLQVIASARGGALYLPYPMSVYRQGAAGSWSARIKDRSRKIPFLLSTLRSLYELYVWLEGRYSRECVKQMDKYLELLRRELILKDLPKVSAVGNVRPVRRLTASEKMRRFLREVKSLGLHRAVTFAIGHRLFLLGNRMKRWSALNGRSTGQM